MDSDEFEMVPRVCDAILVKFEIVFLCASEVGQYIAMVTIIILYACVLC